MTRRMLIAALAFAGVFLAIYLTLYKMGAIGQLACSVGDCETVNLSRWSRFLGLPVAAWGAGFYVVLFAVAMAGTTERFADTPWVSTALLALTSWGVIFSAWLTYLELFVIHAICMWCVVSAVLVTVLFVLSLMDWREHRRPANELIAEG
ncbi:MAG TPA: vitamin K epoxide reductase family protein [Gemmatimonadaceae bacterium]|nr:vitamin K epoxide reductase family protein [Gemmatimonadaceae bacterium]